MLIRYGDGAGNTPLMRTLACIQLSKCSCCYQQGLQQNPPVPN